MNEYKKMKWTHKINGTMNGSVLSGLYDTNAFSIQKEIAALPLGKATQLFRVYYISVKVNESKNFKLFAHCGNVNNSNLIKKNICWIGWNNHDIACAMK